MTTRSHQTTNVRKFPVSHAPVQGMFQSRPFAGRADSTAESQQQPNLETSLMQAEHYGHHLSKTNLANQSAPTSVRTKPDTQPVQLGRRRLTHKKKYDIKTRGRRVPRGTNTNQSVRNHVNDKNTPKPRFYQETFRYKSDNGRIKTLRFRGSNPHMKNQNPRRKTDWDAGHIQGNQISGSGTDRKNIFPQNPIANQKAGPQGRRFTQSGSHRWKNPKSFQSGRKNIGELMAWREWEDKKRRKAEKYRGLSNVHFTAWR